MIIPGIDTIKRDREDIRSFFGLNRQPSPGVGESSDEENVTDDLYPFLTPRKNFIRLTDSFGKCRSMLAGGQVSWIVETGGGSASKLFYGGRDTGVVLTPGEKQTVAMGTKLVVFPDKVCYDTVTGETKYLDASFTTEDGVTVRHTLCRLDGGEMEYDSSPVAPESPSDGALWCDTSATPASLMKYSATSGVWVPVDSTYVKISYPGVGAPFSEGDGVTVSGSSAAALNGSAVIALCDDDFIVVPGILTAPVLQTTPLTVERRAPALDFVVESSNRLWGCRSGLSNDGVLVNEIYATALGDPFNWQKFSGLVSDSYAAGVGSDGPFTGAAVFLGYVMFFKERCVHKVFGNRPSNFQIITSNIRGVAPGASKSLCVRDDVLYYASRDGLMAYDGAFPDVVSDPLGPLDPDGAMCAAGGRKIYYSAKRGGVRELYVFDVSHAVWHNYGALPLDDMKYASCGLLAASDGSLLVIDAPDDGSAAGALTGFSGKTPLPFSWYFESGELTDGRGEVRVVRVEVSAAVPPDGYMKVSLITGDGETTPAVTVRAAVRRTFTVPVAAPRDRRCRLRVEGEGRVVLYSFAKIFE